MDLKERRRINSRRYYHENKDLILAKRRWEIKKVRSEDIEYINWHKIITIWKNITTSQCWICGYINFRPKNVLRKYKGCDNCKNKEKTSSYKNKSLKYWAYVLDIKLNTIHSRIKYWYSIKESIFYTDIPNESFNQRDLKYLSKYLSERHKENKKLEEKAYLKYKQNNLK